MSEITFPTHINFLLQVLTFIFLIVGYYYFRNKQLVKHALFTSSATVINAFSILVVMLPALQHESEHILENVFGFESITLLSHHFIGLLAEVLAGYVMLRWALRSFDTKFCRRRVTMIIIFLTWTISFVSGIIIYLLHFFE